MRNIKIEYKELDVSVSFEDSDRIGKIQEDILRICSLLIYNIEYTKIYFGDETEYILGSDEMKFMDKFSDFLEKIGKNGEDVDIINFEVIERKRDENGNVIKENLVIESFNQYLLEIQNERFLESFQIHSSNNLNMSDIDEIDDLGGISSILNSLNTIPFFNLSSSINQPLNIIQHVSEITIPTNRNRNNSLNIEVEEEEEEEKKEDEITIEQSESVRNELNQLMNTVNEYVDRSRNSRMRINGLLNYRSPLLLQLQNLNIQGLLPLQNTNLNREGEGELIQEFENVNNDNGDNDEEEETKEEEDVSPVESVDSDDEIESTNTTIPLTRTSRPFPIYRSVLNNWPSTNQNDVSFRFPLSTQNQNILNDPENINVLSGLMTNIFGRGHFEVVGEDLNGNIHNLGNLNNFNFNLNSDVKVVISEEQFDEDLNHFEYQEIKDEAKNTKCSICTDEFINNDMVVKTKCDHVFHRDCIKPWLCNESVKCPICREEIIEGKPKL